MTAKKQIKFKNFWGSEKSLSAFLFFLVSVVFIFPLLPSEHLFTELAVDLITVFLLVSGIIAFPQSRTLTITGFILTGTITLITFTSYFLDPSQSLQSLQVIVSIMCKLMITRVILIQIFMEGEVTMHRVLGSVAVYILLAVIWTDFYYLIYIYYPGSFSLPVSTSLKSENLLFQLQYFSFVTLTTVGYGDILALTPQAKTFVVAEALIGQLFPTILIGRLVSLLVSRRNH